MDKRTLFVKTNDKDTAEQLAKLGFLLIQHSNNIWIFDNTQVSSDVLKFVENSDNKIIYSNKLNF